MNGVVKIIRNLSILWLCACGVEAGNPDSTEKDGGKFTLKLTDTSAAGLRHFYVNASALQVGANPVKALPDGTVIDILALGNGRTETILSAERVGQGDIKKIVLSLADMETPVLAVDSEGVERRVAVLDKEQKVSDQLSFLGEMTVAGGAELTAIVDVDLRYTLKAVTEDVRAKVGLDSDVAYVLAQDHTFFAESSRAVIKFSNKSPGAVFWFSCRSF